MNPPPKGQLPLTVIPQDVMLMAMRLVSGQLKSFQITPDMVGKTLAWSGEAHLLDIDARLLGDRADVPAPFIPALAPQQTSANAATQPAAPPVAVSTPNDAPKTVAPAALNKAGGPAEDSGEKRPSQAAQTRILIRDALAIDPGTFLSVVEISDLIAPDTNYRNVDTLRSCVRDQMVAMKERGDVEMILRDKSRVYRLKVQEEV